MKINTSTLMRRKRRYETKSFTDPDVPGQVLTLTLCPQDVLIGAQAQDLADELWEEYGPDKDGEQKVFQMFTDPEDTGPTYLSKTFVTIVAAICVSQGGDPAGIYGGEELAAVALAMPRAFTDACEWAGKLGAKTDQGNRSGAGEASSSAPVSTNTNPTPAPSSGKPNSGDSSMSSCEPLPQPSGLPT